MDERIPESGRTIWTVDGSIRIELSCELDQHRRNFTLAHELGHVLLTRRDLRELAAEVLGPLDRRNEEILCNRFASALLMPTPWVAENMKRRLDFDLLDEMRTSARVSLTAMLIRIEQVSKLRPSVVVLRRSGDGRWRVQSVLAHAQRRSVVRLPRDFVEMLEAGEATRYRSIRIPISLYGTTP